MNLKSLLLVGLVGAGLVGVGQASDAANPDNADTLLRTINFALSARDDGEYVWKSRENCVVQLPVDTGEYFLGYQTIYLNHIDRARTRIERYDVRLADHVEHYVKVALHGDDVILEIPDYHDDPRGGGAQSRTEYTYERVTAEYDRIVQAWDYIYSHGCHSAQRLL